MASDLDGHALRWRMRGFPIYEDDELVGVVTEPEWEWSKLTEGQQATIRQEAVRLQGGRDLSWDSAFLYVLGHYGIACPHEWVNHEPSYRECRRCRTMEQLPGRVVQVGDRFMRVPDPPPSSLLVAVPLQTTWSMADASPIADAPRTVEYRWTGSRYVLASR